MATTYNPLYIFVEGPDDARFVKQVLMPVLSKQYNHIQVQEYAEEKPEKIDGFIKSIDSLGGSYILLCDMDRNPCVTHKIQKTLEKYKRLDGRKGVFVVIKEIESWYLAGLDDNASDELKIKKLSNTNDITKEQFNSMKPGGFRSRIDFMMEVLKRFSIDQARNKNESFDYFMSKAS